MTRLSDAPVEVRRGALRFAAREVFGVFFIAALLLGVSQRVDWLGAWCLIGVYAVWVGATLALLLPRDPALLAERAKRSTGPYTADTIALAVFGVAVMGRLILPALEVRAGGSGSFGPLAMAVGVLLCAAGYGLVLWAMMANTFFAKVLRMQTERDHHVVTGGPYRYVRHPGYLGAILFELGTPLVLGSRWALLPVLVGSLAMLIRTGMEDRVLQRELPGYADYAARTRWRLLPGVY